MTRSASTAGTSRASCVGALGVEGGTAAAATTAPAAAVAPASADAIVAIGTGVLGASIVATAALSTDEQIGIEEILKQCASQAESEVLKERFGGKRPSAEQCNEHAGVNHLGEPLSLAMKLGDEMHRAAYRCLGEKLEKLIPSRFRCRATLPVQPEEWPDERDHRRRSGAPQAPWTRRRASRLHRP